MRTGLTNALREFADFRSLLPRGVTIAPEDVFDGLNFVLSAKLEAYFSTRLLTSAFVQFNEATQELVTNVRFNWIHAPLSDLFLVLTERRDTDGGGVLDRFVTVKVTKLLSF